MNSIQDWLDAFADAVSRGDGGETAALFSEDSQWRDYLPFGWTLKTVEGHDEIAQFVASSGKETCFSNASFEGGETDSEGFFQFKTSKGTGTGYIRLHDGACSTLFTSLNDLSSLEGRSQTQVENEEPFVLIIGGGQSGVALGARLTKAGVPYLIVDKHKTVGGQWRSRYKSLVLHDPVWYDHLPYMPFPDDWPVFTTKDRMADWLETYAAALDLSIWTGTECVSAKFDENSPCWTVELLRDGKAIELKPKHIVMAVGVSGFPRMPEFDGQSDFTGDQMHSSDFRGGDGYSGKIVVVVGANNSAHDIAADLVKHGAKPTMVQRSSTLVVRQAVYCNDLLGPLYSKEAVAKGIDADKADLLTTSLPMRSLEKAHRKLWIEIADKDADFYKKLTDVGFSIDFAEDGTGLGLKYRRTASGYYIDVGASELVADGSITVKSGSGVSHLTESSVVLESGESLSADAVIYATGYGSMTDWVAKIVDQETANSIGQCWGYGSGTKGDPGPWVGELRNMWVETAQKGLWFTGGNLAQARLYSHYLGLQLQGRYAQAS